MAWTGAHVYSLAPGHSITVWYWWGDGIDKGVQIARPHPELLGDDERTGSDFGFLDCRLVASDDAIERHDERKVIYSVTIRQDPGVGTPASRPLFRLIGGGVI
jgi:hypothetical protein